MKFQNTVGVNQYTRYVGFSLLLSMHLMCVSCMLSEKKTHATPFSREIMSMNKVPRVEPKDLISIAVIDGFDQDTIMAVQDELRAKDVVCYIEGSVVYAISVRRDHAKRARKILRNSKLINRERIRILEDED